MVNKLSLLGGATCASKRRGYLSIATLVMLLPQVALAAEKTTWWKLEKKTGETVSTSTTGKKTIAVPRAPVVNGKSDGYSVIKLQPFYSFYFYRLSFKNGDSHAEDFGNTGGLQFQWLYRFPKSNFFITPFDVALSGGALEDKGSHTNFHPTSARPTKYASQEPAYNYDGTAYFFLQARTLFGYGIDLRGNRDKINLLLGVGYQLNHNPKPTPVTTSFISHLLYLPLAVEYAYQSDGFGLNLHVEYDFLLAARRISDFFYLNDVDGIYDLDSLVIKFNEGHGWRLSTEISYNNFIITPFINGFWLSAPGYSFSQSAEKSPFIAHDINSLTLEIGIKGGYQF
ncbi:MAG: hypothetical protein QM529_07520 [Hydrotalea sp.]|nr:hypothetical protein [Hydrotalea sp.]